MNTLQDQITGHYITIFFPEHWKLKHQLFSNGIYIMEDDSEPGREYKFRLSDAYECDLEIPQEEPVNMLGVE